MITATLPAPTAVGAACPCPDHPDRALVPFPGGGARGSCPVNGREYQMTPPEVTW
jgi:hypothetical protein